MSILESGAEKKSLKATDLPSFTKVSLQGIKDEVAEMLNMIGRINEIFATYTKHDISHIDAMLKHLDWLIPPSTQREMTPVDWLLITLAIYFHDLGMLVTAGEYEKREENPEFTRFLARLKSDPKSHDYLGRVKKMKPEEQERFFFQEFIRENHASRVKEWITGRHSRHWGATVTPITTKIANLMTPFPARFRENLATVCESHHRDNLNKRELYPLSQRYGNHPAEIANVQFAAFILRTADLIHVTKDRTPSIMFKTIKLSDPKGVEEWDKQKDTFAVRHAGRTFTDDDTNTHVITVSADFTEERPFFALTEYLAWADSEIRQTKRWSDQSREAKDAENFWFPWHSVKGDLRVEGNAPQQMRFEFDRGKLLDLLVGHAIYNDATVAIRELLQNAIDAVRFRHHLDVKEAETTRCVCPSMGKVSVFWEENARRLVVQDTGTGMDLDVIQYHLMRVGSSFYDTPEFANEHKGFTPISRFGIGILTCFMISDDIEIVTLKKDCGYRIRMSSVHADYLLRELPLGDPKLEGIEPHGTKVTLTIREGVDLVENTVKDILRYWIILPECQVEYIENGDQSEIIGFSSPVEVLSHYYNIDKKKSGDSGRNIEFISKQRQIDGGMYQMAVAVRTGWYPEKAFARPIEFKLPAVCIEGIRVSNALPGFNKQGPVTAIVSVRSVRGLRTTVSRSGLEEDEEFVKLGRISIEMLIEHITDEIQRISIEHGKPLSRASTAAIWLSNDLRSSLASQQIITHFNAEKMKLPLLVIEATRSRDGRTSVERSLICPNELMIQDHFWTIESRLVDSLGTISRDLGRELSLNEFLNSLAPEHAELGHSPILPDANLYPNEILNNHHPELVEFSRQYQQTAIKWNLGNKMRNTEAFIALKDGVFANTVKLEIREINKKFGVKLGLEIAWKVFIARVCGDEADVANVYTRIITVIAKDSEIARVWECNQNILTKSAQNKLAHQFAVCVLYACIFEYCIRMRLNQLRDNMYNYYEDGRLARETTQRIMSFLSFELNNISSHSGGDSCFPESIDFILSQKTFNASDYWRDWTNGSPGR